MFSGHKKRERNKGYKNRMIENHKTSIKKYLYIFWSIKYGPSRLYTGCTLIRGIFTQKISLNSNINNNVS